MVTLKRAYAVAGLGPALQEQLAAGLLLPTPNKN